MPRCRFPNKQADPMPVPQKKLVNIKPTLKPPKPSNIKISTKKWVVLDILDISQEPGNLGNAWQTVPSSCCASSPSTLAPGYQCRTPMWGQTEEINMAADKVQGTFTSTNKESSRGEYTYVSIYL
eukprot:1082344-Rhodomonas_salina.2